MKTVDALIESINICAFPSIAACADFGIKSQEDYEAYFYSIKSQELTREKLLPIVGNGKKLTKLLQSLESNPHKNIIIETAWDMFAASK